MHETEEDALPGGGGRGRIVDRDQDPAAARPLESSFIEELEARSLANRGLVETISRGLSVVVPTTVPVISMGIIPMMIVVWVISSVIVVYLLR
jgi:hypothetical protein